MKDFKLINLLKTFSKTEFREFEKFIASPYFGRGRDLMPLFKAIKTFYPEFTSENFTIEKIYEDIFPCKKYGDARSNSLMKTLISELYKMCIEFLAHSSLKADESRRSYYILDQLRKRKHYTEFEKEFEKINMQENRANKGGVTDFIEKYFLCEVFKNYSLDRDDFNNSFEYTLATDENIVAAALIVIFLSEDIKNISQGYNIPLRYNLMNNVLENLDPENLLEKMRMNNDRFYTYVLIFYMIYKMNKYKENREYYYELKRLVIENKNLFGQTENFLLCNILLTYANVNDLLDEEEVFLYEYILENNFYKRSAGEDFHFIQFRNIVISYAGLGEFDKLEKFIEKYSSELHRDHRENMYNFSYAHLYYSKGNFEKALEYNVKINYDVFIFKIDGRLLQFKTYYNLSYFEEAYLLIDSTLKFLRETNEFSDIPKNYYINVLKNFSALLKLKTSDKPDQTALTFLEKKITDSNPSGQMLWILKKINEMRI